MYRIGVDVGGTNTDAVVMQGRDVLAVVKVPTSADVTTGLIQAISQVLNAAAVDPAAAGLIVIGTTHFTNAVIERRHLSRTAVVRLCLPAAQCLLPMVDWPQDLRGVIGEHVYLTTGGVEFDGTPIAPLDPEDLQRIGADIHARGISAIAISGIFSPVRDQFEREAAEILSNACPGASITLSSSLGQLGLLERESATILNSALHTLAKSTILALRHGVAQCGVHCPMFLSQNDGTLMDAATAERFPVLTFASGPTNSMRGAAFLSGELEAIVLDVGGTTTDVGLLHKGFPRQATTTVDIGGVRTNFRMPDVFSIGLGGGSLVEPYECTVHVGPRSVGYRLTQEARVFGGSTLTATDIVVAGGQADIGDPTLVADLSPDFIAHCTAAIERLLSDAVDRSRLSPDPIPIIAVGGGSVLVPPRLAGLTVSRPKHFGAANAIGAAIAQISGEIDRVFSLEKTTREEALRDAELEARRKAIAAGAIDATLVVTEREDVPLAYLRGNATRVRVKVVGDMRV